MRGITGVLAASSTLAAVLAGLTMAPGAAAASPAGAHPARSWAARVQAAAVTGSFLESVSCRPAMSACTAVGFSISGDSAPHTLAERWDGTAWVSQPTPTPEQNGRLGGILLPTPDPDTFSALYSVSCTGPAACGAAGASSPAVGGTVTPLTEFWNGMAWTIQPAAS
jgi:hypothetical protein